MARAEVGEHVESSGTAHARLAWGRAAEMEKKVAKLGRKAAEQAKALADEHTEVCNEVVKQRQENAALRGELAEQREEIVQLSADSLQHDLEIGVLQRAVGRQSAQIQVQQRERVLYRHLLVRIH